MASVSERQQVTIDDVLRELGTDACDALAARLECSRCFSACRLASRQLRNFIDGGVHALHVRVRQADQQQWESGQLPSLSLWPRVTAVRVQLAEEMANLADPARLLLLLFAGETLENRRRVTMLTLSLMNRDIVRRNTQRAWSCEAVIPSLVHLLPALESLDLVCLGAAAFTGDALAWQLVYDALRNLPNFHTLHVPTLRALPRIGALRDTLQSLTLSYIGSNDGPSLQNPELTLAAVGTITSLPRLSRLTLGIYKPTHGGAAAGRNSSDSVVLRALLDGLSSSCPVFERLELKVTPGIPKSFITYNRCHVINQVDVDTDIYGFNSVPINVFNPVPRRPVLDSTLLAYAQLWQLLLSCRGALGQRLPLLRLSMLDVPAGEEDLLLPRGDGGSPQLQPMLELIRRCDRVEVRELRCSAAAALPLMELLGVPQTLQLTTQEAPNSAIALRLRAADAPTALVPAAAAASSSREQPLSAGGVAPAVTAPMVSSCNAAPGTDPGSAAAAPSPAAPGVDDVARTTLQRLTAARAADDEQQRASDTGGSQQQQQQQRLLLLRGSFIKVLLPAAEGLKGWMEWLAQRAADGENGGGGGGDIGSGAGGGSGGGGGGGQEPLMTAYQALPPALGGVLAVCSGAAGAVEAVAAAAASAATGDATGAVEGLAAGLAPQTDSWSQPIGSAGCAFYLALQQVLQRVWDEGESAASASASGAGGSGPVPVEAGGSGGVVAGVSRPVVAGRRERLAHVLELWGKLGMLPPVVRLCE